jgi:hypothetical protein
MPPDINEADWKVLRRVHPLALERFCGRALTMLAHMRSDAVLTEEEFSSLSQQTRNAVHMLIGAG